MKAMPRSSSASKRAKHAPFTRPKPNWPYKREPWDFLSHLEDLYFWGYIYVRPFRRIFSDPYSGMLNVEHKNRLNEIRADMRGGGRNDMFSTGRPYRKSRGRVPQEMEMIRYRAALNRR